MRMLRPPAMTLLIVLLGLAACAPERAVSTSVEPPPPPPPPPLATDVQLTVQRLAAGSGTTLVSSGIPLQPGRLTAAQLGQVRLFVNEVEQPVHVEALASTHPDGSLRAILVQFDYALDGTTPVAGRLVFGEPRGVADLPKPTADRSSPVAVVLPSDPAYLVTTGINGPTTTVTEARALGPAFTQYEDNFARYADQHWTQEGANWAAANYYDRALIYYAWWARTGNVEYWRRATLLALDYRRNYLEANNYASSPHWSQLEGLEQHYLATGDEASRTAIAETADRLYQGFHATLGSDQWENRIQARVLQSYLLAWRLGATGSTPHDWGALLEDGLTQVLSTQGSDGAYRFPITCGQSLNYMTGLLNDVYIKYYTYYKPDPRIPTAVKRSLDYLWGSQWVPADAGFRYYSAPCGGDPDTASPDLNNLIVTGFGWYAQLMHDDTYRARADAIFAGGVAGAWLDGSKQFNESYSASFRYPAYRAW